MGSTVWIIHTVQFIWQRYVTVTMPKCCMRTHQVLPHIGSNVAKELFSPVVGTYIVLLFLRLDMLAALPKFPACFSDEQWSHVPFSLSSSPSFAPSSATAALSTSPRSSSSLGSVFHFKTESRPSRSSYCYRPARSISSPPWMWRSSRPLRPKRPGRRTTSQFIMFIPRNHCP